MTERTYCQYVGNEGAEIESEREENGAVYCEADADATDRLEYDEEDVEEFEDHAPLSGFESVEDWQDAILELNGWLPRVGRLYRAEVLEDDD